MSWSASPWLAWYGRRLQALLTFLKAHPRATGVTVFGIAALAITSWQSWLWWQSHRPRTFAYNPLRQVIVSITQAPAAITPGAPNKDLKPSGMRIAFSGAPVGPLEKISKDAPDAVTLEPTIPGKWTWLDSQLSTG